MTKLSMVLRSCGKTINLAKSSAYQIPKKPPLNTLIFEKLPEPRCGDKITCGIKGPPITKPVRICTKEDMQAFYCPPLPCDCKVKTEPLKFSQKIRCLISQILKSFLVGGITYYTYKEGLWGDAFRSSCYLGKFIEICPPEEKEMTDNEFAELIALPLDETEPCAPFIPHSDLMLYRLGHFWNKIVIYFFWFLLDAPYELLAAILNFFKPKPKVIEKDPCDLK